MTGTFEGASLSTQFEHKSGVHLTLDLTTSASELNADGSLNEGQVVGVYSGGLIGRLSDGSFPIGHVTVKPSKGKATVSTCFKTVLEAGLVPGSGLSEGTLLFADSANNDLYNEVALTGVYGEAVLLKQLPNDRALVGVLISPVKA